MQRVLDIDLDFFVEDPVFWPPSDERCDPDEHPVWVESEVAAFLNERCGVTARLPGFVTENHGELFPVWRNAIEEGVLLPPFHVTHVDAHADLGLGGSSFEYLMTSLLFESIDDRRYPMLGDTGLNDGSHLAFAVACHWISAIEYVFCEGGGNDRPQFLMEGFDVDADHIQLTALSLAELQGLARGRYPNVTSLEPLIPLRPVPYREFHAREPFDFICLTRSPPYTPVTADPIFDLIRERYVDEPVLP
jgi:hypothetical protein